MPANQTVPQIELPPTPLSLRELEREYLGAFAVPERPVFDPPLQNIPPTTRPRRRNRLLVDNPMSDFTFTIPGEIGPVTVSASVPEFNDDWIRSEVDQEFAACGDSNTCFTCQRIRDRAYKLYKDKYAAKLFDPKRYAAFVAQWENIAIAHAAATFMLEVIYSAKSNEVLNRDTILARLG